MSTDWRPDGYKVHPPCSRDGCFNPARPGKNFCQPCWDYYFMKGRSTGRKVAFCQTKGCENQQLAEGYCFECLRALGEQFARNTGFAAGYARQQAAADPRIVKLEAVANDPAATDAERSSARNLIERLKAKARGAA